MLQVKLDPACLASPLLRKAANLAHLRSLMVRYLFVLLPNEPYPLEVYGPRRPLQWLASHGLKMTLGRMILQVLKVCSCLTGAEIHASAPKPTHSIAEVMAEVWMGTLHQVRM
jgi:hypothetical protein